MSYHTHYWSVKAVKGTVVFQTCQSVNLDSLEITSSLYSFSKNVIKIFTISNLNFEGLHLSQKV